MSQYVKGLDPQLQEHAVRCAMTIVAPNDATPVERYRDLYGTSKTSVGAPRFDKKLDWFVTGGVASNQSPQVDIKQQMVVYFRDLLRSIVYLEENPAYGVALTGQYSYTAAFYNPLAVPKESFGPAPVGPLTYSSDIFSPQVDEFLDPIYWEVFDTYLWQPHGPILYPGRTPEGVKTVWIDATTTAKAKVGFDIAGGAINGLKVVQIKAWRWDGGKLYPIHPGNNPETFMGIQIVLDAAGAGNGEMDIDASGYYAFQYVPQAYDNAAGGAAQTNMLAEFRITKMYLISSVNLGRAFAHRPADQIELEAPNILQARILGKSAWIKNTASPLNQQGMVVATQASPNEDWYENYAQNGDPYLNVSNTAIDRDYRLAEGHYSYLKPQTQHDFEWLDNFRIGIDHNITDFYFNLIGHGYVIIAMQVAANGAGDVKLQLNTAVEFTTRSRWRELEAATVSPDAWKEATLAVSGMDQFFENETHWTKIVGTLAKGATGLGSTLMLFGGPAAAVGAGLTAIGTAGQAVADYFEEKDATKSQVKAQQAMEAAKAVGPHLRAGVDYLKGRFKRRRS